MTLKISFGVATLAVAAKYVLRGAITSSAARVFLTSFITLFVATKIYQLFIYPSYFSPLRNIPGPQDHHFLVGQAINQYRAKSPNEPYVSWVQKWPRADFIRFTTFGNADALLITSLAAHKEILQAKCYSFVKPPFFKRLVADIVGLGLVFSEGEDHKNQRKAFRGMFALGNLKSFIPLFRSKAEELCELIDRAIAKDDGVVEVIELYSRLMLDIIGVFGLGVDLENLSSEHSVFHDCYHETFAPGPTGMALTAINAFVPIRWLPVKANRDFIRANGIVHSILGNIVKQRIAEVQEARKQPDLHNGTSGDEKSKDLLTYMVEEKYFGDGGDHWSEDDMLNQILNFVAGGHETTASLLVWATHVLTVYPEVERRVFAEITQLLKRSPRPDYVEIESLKYLNNFMREVLRVHCPAINSAAREAAEDVVVQGILILKGTTILGIPAVVHFSPSIWGPDPEVFNPDRWDVLSGEAADMYAFQAFSQGPRICIGRQFGVMEFKTILIELVKRFRFERIGSGEVEVINPGVVLRPLGGLKVKVVRRE